MTKETKKWWESSSKDYQKTCKIPIDIHYGPGSPNERHFKLLGNLKGKKILEIGCGGAQCGIAMAKQGAKVIGIDISEEQLKFAKKLSEKNKVKIKFYQGDIKNLRQIKSNSQDIVFSAFALQYVDNLLKCFKEVKRVLKKKGLFVFSFDHPFSRTVDPKTLKLKESYFKIGKCTISFSDKTKKFVMYTHTISETHNTLISAGFNVKKIIEPDSRKKYSYGVGGATKAGYVTDIFGMRYIWCWTPIIHDAFVSPISAVYGEDVTFTVNVTNPDANTTVQLWTKSPGESWQQRGSNKSCANCSAQSPSATMDSVRFPI